MKAVLIIIFAVYVTTAASIGDFDRDEVSNNSDLDIGAALFGIPDDGEIMGQCTEKAKGSFSLWDYSVVLAMLVVSLKIGLFYGFFDKSAKNNTDHKPTKMGLFPVTLSLATSFITAIELLGNPAEMYFYGSQFSLIGK